MENLFLKYMGDRLESSSTKLAHQGPVITISRECGCPGNDIAAMLMNKLNKKMVKDGHAPKWKWVNKEILLKTSEELKMNPRDVETYVKARESGVLHDLVASFTETYYVRNANIKKVIHDVILHLAIEGHVIIVGRGGGAIAWNISKSLHLYLEAPLSWKSGVVSTQKGIPLAEARKFVLERDIQRLKFRDNFRAKFSDEIYYDERFNCKSLTNEQICELAFHAAELKKLI
ncbi:MAG: cytidylate kinase-like family protein [Bacteroidia bacterium]|nr:cytidylate kinase-like family protein [Bacteroidia bacterium]